MQNVFLVFSADQWLTHSSKKLEAVFTKQLHHVVKEVGDRYRLTEWEREFLTENRQTQGRDENIIIETKEVNTFDAL